MQTLRRWASLTGDGDFWGEMAAAAAVVRDCRRRRRRFMEDLVIVVGRCIGEPPINSLVWVNKKKEYCCNGNIAIFLQIQFYRRA